MERLCLFTVTLLLLCAHLPGLEGASAARQSTNPAPTSTDPGINCTVSTELLCMPQNCSVPFIGLVSHKNNPMMLNSTNEEDQAASCGVEEVPVGFQHAGGTLVTHSDPTVEFNSKAGEREDGGIGAVLRCCTHWSKWTWWCVALCTERLRGARQKGIQPSGDADDEGIINFLRSSVLAIETLLGGCFSTVACVVVAVMAVLGWWFLCHQAAVVGGAACAQGEAALGFLCRVAEAALGFLLSEWGIALAQVALLVVCSVLWGLVQAWVPRCWFVLAAGDVFDRTFGGEGPAFFFEPPADASDLEVQWEGRREGWKGPIKYQREARAAAQAVMSGLSSQQAVRREIQSVLTKAQIARAEDGTMHRVTIKGIVMRSGGAPLVRWVVNGKAVTIEEAIAHKAKGGAAFCVPELFGGAGGGGDVPAAEGPGVYFGVGGHATPSGGGLRSRRFRGPPRRPRSTMRG